MEPTCRMCLEAGGEEGLVSPCAGCRGSSALVHRSCVEKFYRARKVWWEVNCPTCKLAYDPQTTLALGRIGLPKLRRALRNARSKLEAKARGADVAALLSVLGTAYDKTGQGKRECAVLEEALQLAERAFGRQHPEAAKALSNLGGAVGRNGDLKRQRRLLTKALEIHQREYGADNPQSAMILSNLASAYGRLDDKATMCKLLERALKVLQKHFGPDKGEIAVALTNLGIARGELGQQTRKRDLLARALSILERELGPEHREIALVAAHLGAAHVVLRKPAEGRQLLERALAIWEREGLLERPETARVMAAIAVACSKLGDRVQQRVHVEQGFLLLRRLLGARHPGVQAVATLLEGEGPDKPEGEESAALRLDEASHCLVEVLSRLAMRQQNKRPAGRPSAAGGSRAAQVHKRPAARAPAKRPAAAAAVLRRPASLARKRARGG